MSLLSQVVQRWQGLVFPLILVSAPTGSSTGILLHCATSFLNPFLLQVTKSQLFKLHSWNTPVKRIRNERVCEAQDPYGILKIFFRQWPIFYAFSIDGSFDSVRVISSVCWRAPDWKITKIENVNVSIIIFSSFMTLLFVKLYILFFHFEYFLHYVELWSYFYGQNWKFSRFFTTNPLKLLFLKPAIFSLMVKQISFPVFVAITKSPKTRLSKILGFWGK